MSGADCRRKLISDIGAGESGENPSSIPGRRKEEERISRGGKRVRVEVGECCF